MKHCTLSKSQAFCNHAQVDEHFEYRSKTKVRKHNPLSLKQNVNQNDKAKNVLEKTTKLKFIFARKNLGTRNYSFWQVKMRFFFCVAQIINVDFFEKRAAFRNNHCCNFQKFCCEVCRKHSLLQCVTCFLLRRLSPNI